MNYQVNYQEALQTRPWILLRMSSISKVLLETLILYLLICCFFLTRVIRINRKPEKSEHKLFQPASPVSCEQHSYGGWAPQPLTLIQPFTLPSIRTDLCFTKIIHSLYSFDPPSSPTSPILCSCDRSQQSPGNLVHHNEEGLRLPYSMTEDLKKRKMFPESFENIELTVRWCSVVCLDPSCGLVMWIPEIFHYLSRWCF